MAEVALALASAARLSQYLYPNAFPKMFVQLLQPRKKNRGQDVLDHNEEEKEPLPKPHFVQKRIRGGEDKGSGGGKRNKTVDRRRKTSGSEEEE